MKDVVPKSIVAENVRAVSPTMSLRRKLSMHTRMCWKCQQDKPYRTGKVTKRTKLFSPADKFICADCIAAKAAKGTT